MIFQFSLLHLFRSAVATCLLLAFVSSATAQQFSVSGYVEDADSGERLAYATIYDDVHGTGTTANGYGFFRFTAAEGRNRLIVSYVGYRADTLSMEIRQDTSLVVSLHSQVGQLQEVGVSAGRVGLETNMHVLTAAEIAVLPALAGESDVMKAIQTLPGIRSGTEGTSGLYVRGGSPDQNLILLDGAPIYHAAHLFGFLSLFNPSAIQRVRVLKGGFPARYGGRLSAVIDVDTKEGNLNESIIRAGISPVAARFLIEGPIRRGRSSYLLSSRRTFLDGLAKLLTPGGALKLGAYFYDVNGKINHALSSESRLYGSVYAGRDRYYRHSSESIEGRPEEYSREGINWTNLAASLKWTRVISPKLFFSAAALASDYRLALYDHERAVVNGNVQLAGLRYTSGIRDYGLRAALDIFAGPNHTARVGLQLVHHRFLPGAAHYRGTEAPDTAPHRYHAIESAAYVEDEISILTRWQANIGLRASSFNTEGRSYASLEPRISLSYSVSEHGAVSASFSAMQQYVHLLASSGVGMPTDLWLPTTERIHPERALQTTAGYVFKSTDLEARIEGSYKEMSGLLEYRDGASFAGIESDWQDEVTQGEGHYVGVEIYLRKAFRATSATAAYTLSRTRRRFSEIDGGSAFPYRYDRPHEIALTLIHEFSDRRSFTTFWTYGSGDAITVPRAWYFDPTAGIGGRVYSVFDSRGNYRTPAYHRLDVVYRIRYDWSWGDGVLGLGMYNAYGRDNPFYMYIDTDPANRYGSESDVPALKLKKVSFFRFIPFVSLDVTL